MEHTKLECVTGGGRCWTGGGKWAGGKSGGERVHVVERKLGPETPGVLACKRLQLHRDGTEVIGCGSDGDSDGWGGSRVGGRLRGRVGSVNVGAECESEKEVEAGAKPHHKQCLHCMTHNFIKFHGTSFSLCVSRSYIRDTSHTCST